MQTQQADGNPRTLTNLSAALFIFAGIVNLLTTKWLDAAFYLVGGFVFLKVKEMNRWPKAVGYLVVLILLALAVAMLVELIFQAKTIGRP